MLGRRLMPALAGLLVATGVAPIARAGNDGNDDNSGSGNNGNGTGSNAGNGRGNNGNGKGNGESSGSGATSGSGSTASDPGGCDVTPGKTTAWFPDLSSPGAMPGATQFRVCARQQARVTIPSLVTFNVIDVAQATPQDGTAGISADQIALFAGRHLEIAIAPSANAFVDPTNHASYAASKVSWVASASTNGSVVPGAFGAAATYVPILVCTKSVTSCAGSVKFTLAADPTQTVAGQHVLTGSYRVSSVL